MQDLIYYPGFEIQNPDWLKFALLYLDKLNPIIPKTGDQYLSSLFQRLKDETDLIEMHRPRDDEGFRATLDAIEEIEKVLSNPYRYAEVFHREDVDQIWKDSTSWRATLFRDKYTGVFEKFCIQNKLGKPCQNGLQLHRDVLWIYMTILSQVIADARGISAITDNPFLDKFSIFARKANVTDEHVVEAAQCVLNLKLPANLSSLSLEDIIRHRNRSGFREKQKAFHLELNNFLSSVEAGNLERFSESPDNILKDFADDILLLSTGVLSFGAGVWVAVQSPLTVGVGVAMIAQGLDQTANRYVSIKSTWKNTKSKRFARRYLSDLSTLKPAHF
ncbi:hypothetical protein H6F67_26195 [Microcoleus sp. FACHB-1515]|uniref:hypothetical protein n=1 Tax=Cyanophyceae TaxID=3028117 RepID=UPI001684C826|nr:hypothetical protein [Microcoleus sp. FACHB-1515]MBD2093340.1 hypothetical protein [Microcoleus sp. FACHB-1515]